MNNLLPIMWRPVYPITTTGRIRHNCLCFRHTRCCDKYEQKIPKTTKIWQIAKLTICQNFCKKIEFFGIKHNINVNILENNCKFSVNNNGGFVFLFPLRNHYDLWEINKMFLGNLDIMPKIITLYNNYWLLEIFVW